MLDDMLMHVDACFNMRCSYTLRDMSASTCHVALYVSFAEYSLFYRALLQKRPIINTCLRQHVMRRATYSDMYIILSFK